MRSDFHAWNIDHKSVLRYVVERGDLSCDEFRFGRLGCGRSIGLLDGTPDMSILGDRHFNGRKSLLPRQEDLFRK